MKPTRKPGFTLIELLVVIAIIAILAAILFPVFADTHARWARVEQTWTWWRADHQPLPLPDSVCVQRRVAAGG